eukprot:4460107-Amphidinium_carterae.1
MIGEGVGNDEGAFNFDPQVTAGNVMVDKSDIAKLSTASSAGWSGGTVFNLSTDGDGTKQSKLCGVHIGCYPDSPNVEDRAVGFCPPVAKCALTT